MPNFQIVNILDMKESIGEDELKKQLSGFSCPLNAEIEHFVRVNAIEFSKSKSSITYLVVNGDDSHIVGIFCLAHKAIEISCSGLSKTIQKKMLRFSELSDEDQSYNISAFLIAQLGKNYQFGEPVISGDDLMDLSIEVLESVQKQIGGCVIYLECEDKEKLLKFYQNGKNLFNIFDKRTAKDRTVYLQLYKWL